MKQPAGVLWVVSMVLREEYRVRQPLPENDCAWWPVLGTCEERRPDKRLIRRTVHRLTFLRCYAPNHHEKHIPRKRTVCRAAVVVVFLS